MPAAEQHSQRSGLVKGLAAPDYILRAYSPLICQGAKILAGCEVKLHTSRSALSSYYCLFWFVASSCATMY